MAIDEVFIDGLPVGSVFAFVWNCLSKTEKSVFLRMMAGEEKYN